LLNLLIVIVHGGMPGKGMYQLTWKGNASEPAGTVVMGARY
jgi:hypothetical protein